MRTILEPGRAEKNYWRDLWHYRELFQVLAWRDVSVRYKQTIIGVAWALIRPFLTMIVFTIIFSKVAKLPSEGTAPYALMVFVGMLPWTFFSTALSEASNSLVSNANLISKVYFPRLIVPTATVVVAFIDFLISFVILVGMMAWYRFMPGPQILLLPVFIVLAFFASLGPGLWITALIPQIVTLVMSDPLPIPVPVMVSVLPPAPGPLGTLRLTVVTVTVAELPLA